ncbi:hypothetical protein [Archangium lansingense]|uniref:Uncharacterized protein n=1 Tax=Archangium lansingense TaxID=2995310 RepID=A0ABT4AMK8_9BACT|nr:hypothetical protein [Archangium lansinium]MCY1082414.1 hypothetical protein [Archangium lansinium]
MKHIALAVLVSLTFASNAHAALEDEAAREIRLLRAQSARLQKQLERDVRRMAKTAPRLDAVGTSQAPTGSGSSTDPKQP